MPSRTEQYNAVTVKAAQTMGKALTERLKDSYHRARLENERREVESASR